MNRQQALDLPVATGFGRGDFLVSDSNRAAFGWIERWPDWPARALVLYGPAGSGKTHLAHLWRQNGDGVLIAGEAVAAAEPWRLAGLIAVDDADRAAEEPLLHLYNSAIEQGAHLLLTLRNPPVATAIALPDLASRLRALPAAGIAAPDDALIAAVLVKHFADRQIRVAPGVIAYLLPRMERSLAAAGALAARLDRLALAAARPVSIKLARAALAELVTEM